MKDVGMVAPKLTETRCSSQAKTGDDGNGNDITHVIVLAYPHPLSEYKPILRHMKSVIKYRIFGHLHSTSRQVRRILLT